MNIQTAIERITQRQDLSSQDMTDVIQHIMAGKASPAQIGAFLVGLRMKGETVDEITAAARVMRELAVPVHVTGQHLVDIVGTGGDQANTFNISTTSAFVVAAAGGQVAKHGNRAVSSRSGSADVLEAAGVNLSLTPEQVAQCVNEIGIGYMLAPQHHRAWKHVTPARKDIGIRTLFNILGPLLNPAGTPNQVMGVYDAMWLEPVAQVLKALGSHHVMVVHSDDGLDEISIGATTQVTELVDDNIKTYTITPEQFGFEIASIEALVVDGVEDSLNMMRQVLNNEKGPARDIVSMNAGAAIYVAGLTNDLAEGVKRAQTVIENGKAKTKLQALIDITQSF